MRLDHMTPEVTWQELEEDGGDSLSAPVSVEDGVALMDLESLSDLSLGCIVLSEDNGHIFSGEFVPSSEGVLYAG